jgi:hypothetical protein
MQIFMMFRLTTHPQEQLKLYAKVQIRAMYAACLPAI